MLLRTDCLGEETSTGKSEMEQQEPRTSSADHVPTSRDPATSPAERNMASS